MNREGGMVRYYAGTVALGVLGLVVAVGLIAGCTAGAKEFQRYQSRQDAENDLKRAEFSKKIRIEEAKAENASADELAAAEIKRARGVASANEIIADSITPNYLRYFYIQQLADAEGTERIYIPTEAGIPILEARPR